MKYDVLNDQQLVKLYLESDESAFEALVTRHKNKIWSHIYLLVRDRDITEDLFQDTFIKVIRTLRSGRYNEEGKFLPWVMRIAHNITIDHFRKAKKMPMSRSRDDYDVFGTISDGRDTIEQKIVNAQIDADVRKLIDGLPDEQRQVVIMRTYLNLSFKEIADYTGVSINTALGRMRYALINMRKVAEENKMQLNRV